MHNRSMHAREFSESVARASLDMAGVELMAVKIKGCCWDFAGSTPKLRCRRERNGKGDKPLPLNDDKRKKKQ